MTGHGFLTSVVRDSRPRGGEMMAPRSIDVVDVVDDRVDAAGPDVPLGNVVVSPEAQSPPLPSQTKATRAADRIVSRKAAEPYHAPRVDVGTATWQQATSAAGVMPPAESVFAPTARPVERAISPKTVPRAAMPVTPTIAPPVMPARMTRPGRVVEPETPDGRLQPHQDLTIQAKPYAPAPVRMTGNVRENVAAVPGTVPEIARPSRPQAAGPETERAEDEPHPVATAESPSPIDDARTQTVIETERVVIPSRVVTEIGSRQQPPLHRDTPMPSEPRVHIGVVEVVVAAPADTRPPAPPAASPSAIASRRYLRSL